MYRTHRPLLICLGMLIVSIASYPSGLLAESGDDVRIQGQRGPTFNVTDILPAERIQGPGYTIEREVVVVNHDYLFKIKTELGTIPALGHNMLNLRLQEMHAIEQAKAISENPEIVEGAAASVEDTVEGGLTLLSDPIGSLKRAPTGFGRMVKGKLDSADRRAGGPERRKLAAQVGCDPETRNPVLKHLLDEISLRQKIGGFAAKAIPHTGILRMTEDIKGEVASQPPHVINERIEADLATMGVEEYLREKFTHDEQFTTLQRLVFMSYFSKLKGISGFASVLKAAVEVDSEAEALGVIETAHVLSQLHGKNRIRKLAHRGLPIAFMDDGSQVVYAPYDYVTGSSEVRDAVASYRKDYPDAASKLLVPGQVASEAKAIFKNAGIQVTEKVKSGR